MDPAVSLTLRDVPGMRVGHWTDPVGLTGCTVVLADGGAIAGVDLRGSAPGTRETDLLRPSALVERIDAICLAGGSAFGLAAVDGVMRFLSERGIGYDTGVRPVPIVPAAIIFDLGVGDPDAHPGPDAGYAACLAAGEGSGPMSGRVGAGTGATVGKLAGMEHAKPGGIGSAGVRLADGTVVAALVVNNAVGNVVGRDGTILAGAPIGDAGGSEVPGAPNTVLTVVATDAALDRAQCQRLATAAHDGIARAVSPAHTLLDGDVSFALASGLGSRPAGTPWFLAMEMAGSDAVRAALEVSVRAS